MSIFASKLKKNTAYHGAGLNDLNNEQTPAENEDISLQESLDQELPSVNRRKGGNKLIDVLGIAAIIGGGLVMLYYVNSGQENKAPAPIQKKEVIANRLPPLELPAPEAPVPIDTPPAQLQPSQPIPVQAKQQTNATPVKSWIDRKREGSVLITANAAGGGASGGGRYTETQPAVMPEKPDESPLGLKLKPSSSPGVSASMLPNRDYLITKGTALDCALETAIDSTVPGLTTCRLTRDVYSDNGHVVLLDRGTQLVGEYQGGVTAGQARLFVLWTRAKTPNGVIVNLDSPGTDTVGRSGHEGWVDTHFFQRFGAAIMMSLVKDTLIYARNRQQGATVVIGGGNGNSDQLATEILKNTVAIPPTLYINQGDHLQIMVARDLDFSTVYGLKLKE